MRLLGMSLAANAVLGMVLWVIDEHRREMSRLNLDLINLNAQLLAARQRDLVRQIDAAMTIVESADATRKVIH